VFDGATFSWTPSVGQARTYQVPFIASDGVATSAPGVVTIIVSQVNQPPILAPIGNKSVVSSSTLAFTISATDPNGSALTYTAQNLPIGGTFNQATKVFSWRPTREQVGVYQTTFVVSDGRLTDIEAITITVTQGNKPPLLIVPATRSARVGSPLSFTVNASDPDGDKVIVTASGLPESASFDETKKLFSWVPKTAGKYTVTFMAQEVGNPEITIGAVVGLSIKRSVQITVTGVSVPTQTSVPAAGGEVVPPTKSVPTTKTTIDASAIETLEAQLNELNAILNALRGQQ
jgi:hypothetical protein